MTVRVVGTYYGRLLCLDTDPFQGRPLITNGLALEHNEIMRVRRMVEKLPSGTVIDVGAHIGIWTLGLANYCDQVHAFEPQPFICNMLAGSIALNGYRHIQLHDCVLGAERGELDIPNFRYDWPGNFGSIEFGHEQREYMGQTQLPSAQRVPVMPLDDFWFERVRFIKIDVEGMEMDVLDGAEQTIRGQKVPLLLVEYLKGDRHALRERLEAWGYEVTVSPGSGSYLCERIE